MSPVQETLWGTVPLPHARGSQTSAAAADSAAPTADAMRQKVLAAFRLIGPATDEQVQNLLNLSGNTERPRRVELVTRGLLIHVDDEGRTSSGRRAARWAVAPKAVQPKGGPHA